MFLMNWLSWFIIPMRLFYLFMKYDNIEYILMYFITFQSCITVYSFFIVCYQLNCTIVLYFSGSFTLVDLMERIYYNDRDSLNPHIVIFGIFVSRFTS